MPGKRSGKPIDFTLILPADSEIKAVYFLMRLVMDHDGGTIYYIQPTASASEKLPFAFF